MGMAVTGNMLRIYKIAGNCRSLLLPQPNVGVKQTAEEKLGFPTKPKRPLTPYFKFMAQIRPSLKQKNPNTKLTDLSKLGAQQWEKADPAVRQQFENEYKQEMTEFIQEQKKYEENLTLDQREEIQRVKAEEDEIREKRRLRKKMKELGKPRKPAGAFLNYVSEYQSLRNEMNFKDFMQKMAKDWANLPVTVKSKYIDTHKQALECYKQDIQVWEEKMIRLGHIDVVRNEALIEPGFRISRSRKRFTQITRQGE